MREQMLHKNQTKNRSQLGLSAFFLLPVFWFFILMIILKIIYPLFSFTSGSDRVYALAAVMFLFALAAPYVHNFFYQVNYGKMATLWVAFTLIGFFRLDYKLQSQSQIFFHMLSWQLPAIVFSLIYTLLYSKSRSINLETADS